MKRFDSIRGGWIFRSDVLGYCCCCCCCFDPGLLANRYLFLLLLLLLLLLFAGRGRASFIVYAGRLLCCGSLSVHRLVPQFLFTCR